MVALRKTPRSACFSVQGTMSQSRVNLATARRELAERQDEVNLFTAELKAAQEVMAAGGTGPKTLTVSERA